MSNFASARRTMIDNQIRTTDVTDARVIAAFGATPRELFVPGSRRELAYIDEAHRLATSANHPARWLMSPSPFAKLVQLAEVASTDNVLVVGSGSGYSVAVLAHLAASVVGLEEDPALVASSQAALSALHLQNARIAAGGLTSGVAAAAPFDVILIEGAVDVIPSGLSAQMADRGRLVTVEGAGLAGFARIYTKSGNLVTGRTAFNIAAKPLPGFDRAVEFVF